MAEEQENKQEPIETPSISTEDKIRFNIKQSAKGVKYFDITVRGATIEEIAELYKKVEDFAYQSGCMRL